MSKKIIKAAIVAIPAVMALSAAPADAKILLMGDGGWEVSFDGSVNGFYVHKTTEALPTKVVAGARQTGIGLSPTGNDSSAITTGLLPAVWGMNIKAPTTNGLDVSARIGIYPQIQNAAAKNNLGSATGTGDAGAQVDLREIFFAVDGSFGQVLVGRTLSLFEGKAILNDMTLFGVGAGGSPATSGTTLGRIGFGYVYPNFNAGIRYASPTINGVKLQVGVFQPSVLGATTGLINANVSSATETPTPRFEGELSYAGNLGGITTSLWASGSVQNAEQTVAGRNNQIANFVTLSSTSNTMGGTGTATAAQAAAGTNDSATMYGGELGLNLGYAGFNLSGSIYGGQGLGLTVQANSLLGTTSGIDAVGEERDNWGGYAQGTYAFGQGTSIGLSYGLNGQSSTEADEAQRGTLTQINTNSLWDVMVWHDINKNLRVVAEYGLQETTWMDGANTESNIVSVGGFFFW